MQTPADTCKLLRETMLGRPKRAPGYRPIGNDYPPIDGETKPKYCKPSNMIVAFSVVGVLCAIAAIVVAVLAYNAANFPTSFVVHQSDGILSNSISSHYLESSGVPLAMTLPSDLSNYIGRKYSVWSTTSQVHTIRIASGGFDPTFGGTATLATFGGAIGDGLVFEVMAKNLIVAIQVFNVVFTI